MMHSGHKMYFSLSARCESRLCGSLGAAWAYLHRRDLGGISPRRRYSMVTCSAGYAAAGRSIRCESHHRIETSV